MYKTSEITDKYGLKTRLYKVGRKTVAKMYYPNQFSNGKYSTEWVLPGLCTYNENEQAAHESAVRAVNNYLSSMQELNNLIHRYENAV